MVRLLAVAVVFAAGLGTQVYAAPPDPPGELLRVNTPTQADRTRLTGLDLDLTESAGSGYIDVVAHSNGDRSRLTQAGFTWTTVPAEPKATDATALPSGRTAYREPADYDNDLAGLAKRSPKTAKLFSLPEKSLEGRTLRGLEITHDVGVSDGKPVFLMLGLHHAREWPSGELTIEFAYDLLKNDGTDARITNILAKSRVIVVPVVNPDGFALSRTLGYELKRKNCRVTDDQVPPEGQCEQSTAWAYGVDLNRNYSGSWGGPGASGSLNSETYRGASAFSEPETRDIQALISHHQVTTLVSNHTYGNLILREPGVSTTAVTPDESIYKALGDRMAATNGYTSQYSYQLYDTSGATEDWSYYATGGLGFTFEHGGSTFHPDFSSVLSMYAGNREAFLLAAEAAIDPARHSVITGTAPAGAVLRLTKSFTTTTWGGKQLPDTLATTMTVPATGKYTWHTNPSTRPAVVQQGGTEAWTLTCARSAGQPTETQSVTVARGASVTANLTTC